MPEQKRYHSVFAHKLAGIMALAVVSACLCGAGVWGYYKFYGKDEKTGQGAATQGSACLSCKKNTSVTGAQLPENKKTLFKPSLDDLQGTWKAHTNGGVAVVVFFKGVFRITYTTDDEGRLRKYSGGRYTYDEKSGVLALMPSKDFAEPEPVPGVTYKVLTLRYFDLMVLKDKEGRIIYWTPPEDMLAARRVHPLFFYIGGDIPVLKWDKVD